MHTRQRHKLYGRDYFTHAVLPNCKELINDIEVSVQDAEKIFSAFVSMDTNGNEYISNVEFHRYFGWKRGVFTERIFDIYAAATKDDSLLCFDEFLIMVYNYCSYDTNLMCRYVWNIFDIDCKGVLSLDVIDALIRMVYFNQDGSTDEVMSTLREATQGSSTISFDTFKELVENDKSILQPAFDIQSRLIEKTTGDKTLADGTRSCWQLYRERRRNNPRLYVALPDFKCKDKIISSVAQCDEGVENYELTQEFLTSLFHRVERSNNSTPEGFDHRLEEERYVDKLRESLAEVETALDSHFIVEQVEDRKALRKRLYTIIDEIKDAHIDALYAELDRDLGLWDRSRDSKEDNVLEFTSEEEIHDHYEHLVATFIVIMNWKSFVDSYEGRLGLRNTCWEKLYDPEEELSFYYQWQTGEKVSPIGNLSPAICEVCDSLIDLTDYKCFSCDSLRSVRNRTKYRGRISLEEMEAAV